jgi:hypothetical protein
MLLLLRLQTNKNKVAVEFDESVNDFSEFERIFKSLKEVDNLCRLYLSYFRLQGSGRIKVHSEVKSLSKNSPFSLTAFVTDHWFEIFLFVLGSYDRIRPNAQLIIKDSGDIAGLIKESFKDIIKDFPELEYENIAEVVRWFNDLPIIERVKIARMMIRQNKVLRKIKKISFKTDVL